MNSWDLSPLYTSLQSEKYIKDVQKLESLIKEYEALNINCINKKEYIEKYLFYTNNTNSLLDSLYLYPKLLLRTNINNQDAKNAMAALEKYFVSIATLDTKHLKVISEFDDLESLLSKNVAFSPYIDALKSKIAALKHRLEPDTESIIAEFKSSGSFAWYDLRNNLVENLRIRTDDGKEYSIADYRKLYETSDQKLQEQYFNLEKSAYKKIDISCCAALINIKKQTYTESKLRGFKDPLEMILSMHRMSKSCLESMLKVMPKLIHSFEKYNMRKAKILNRASLPLYSVYTSTCSCEPKIEYSQAIEIILKTFGKFTPELADFTRKAITENWIDSKPATEKLHGSYCNIIPQIGQSRISTHYTGTIDSVYDLAHELGHGFHGECLAGQEYINTDFPIPIAETASLMCENLVSDEMISLFSDNEERKRCLLERNINKTMLVILDNLCFYNFEKEVFDSIEKSSNLTSSNLCDIMEKYQKYVYGQCVNWDYLEPYAWIRKIHCYFPDYYYYNFPYIFGYLLSIGLTAKLDDGSLSFEDLKRLLIDSGKYSIDQLTQSISIDISSLEFWESSATQVIGQIEDYIKLTDNLI